MRTKSAGKWLLCALTALCLMCGVAAVCVPSTNANAATGITLSVDTLGYARSELPQGYAGKSYPVFAYTATDADGAPVANADVTVFDPSGKMLPLKNDRFDTAVEGKYKMEYTARKDSVFAQDTIEITVLGASAYTAPTYAINADIKGSVLTGENVLLPEGVMTGEGAKADVSVTYAGDYTCEPQILGGDGAVYFVPEAAGTYTLKYEITDFVGGTNTATKTITVTDSELPILRVPSVSKVAHVGAASKYPIAEAILYRNGEKIYVPVKTFVNDTDITQSMMFAPTQAGTYTVKYSAANIYDAQKVAESEHTVTVYGDAEPSDAYANRFFAFDNMTMTYRNEVQDKESFVTVLTAVAQGNKATFDFKNPIREEFLSVALGAEGKANSFGSLNIRFVDSKHADESICITLKENDDKKVEVSLNGKKVADWNKTFTGDIDDYTQSSFTVRYDAATKSLLDEDGAVIAPIAAYENGTVFRGFTSKSAYLQMEMAQVTQSSQVKLYRIAGQTISDAPADTLTPMLIYRDGYMRTQNADMGETVTVGHIGVFDLFDIAPTIKATVTSPSGKQIYSGDITSDYSFEITEYGTYSVEYVGCDASGREQTVRAIVQVIDRIAPEIKIKDYVSKVTKNTEYTFAEAEVSDNYSKDVTTWISVSYNGGAAEYATDGKYTFRKAGAYTITYGAEDAAGNRTFASYTVKCE